jgi:hypothetical protein
MPQIFHHSANTIYRFGLFGIGFIVAAISGVVYVLAESSYVTEVDVVRDQPVAFSHEHHVDGLGIDCRFCHTSVEESSFAGIPPTETCMECHQILWNDSPKLAPVRESYRTGEPLKWTRVHDVPDYVYFNHSIHVQKGVGCSTCHGQVDEMPLMRKEASLYMQWCLNCHRNPERYVRPREEVFNMDWEPPANQLEMGKKLVEKYHIQEMTNCSTCHR